MKSPAIQIGSFRITFLIIVILAFTFSCEQDPPDPIDSVPVYKFKNGTDYTQYVQVTLNRDKTRVISFPMYGREKTYQNLIIDYYKGYYLGGLYYPNSAILDILIEDYDSVYNNLSEYTLEDHILEKEPFEEFYYDSERYLNNSCPECLEKDTIWLGVDTAKFHQLVNENTLDLYLERIL
jgi:hypothetical protein